ncbi:MAG: PIN domain-containing protein [Gemmatimonadota bacterium]
MDTSVVVAGFASWHEGHAGAYAALAEVPRLPAHVALESYSVLTRLPPPHRTTAEIVVSFLERRFPDTLLTLPAAAHRRMLNDAAKAGIAGGALYDALVAATARHAGGTLLTRDRRATRTYQAMGIDFRLMD